MIILKKLDDEEFVLNSKLIEAIMETPDTTIFLTNGKHLIARESREEVVKKIVEFRRSAFRGILGQIKGWYSRIEVERKDVEVWTSYQF